MIEGEGGVSAYPSEPIAPGMCGHCVQWVQAIDRRRTGGGS